LQAEDQTVERQIARDRETNLFPTARLINITLLGPRIITHTPTTNILNRTQRHTRRGVRLERAARVRSTRVISRRAPHRDNHAAANQEGRGGAGTREGAAVRVEVAVVGAVVGVGGVDAGVGVAALDGAEEGGGL
jgi:hypothetical protein